MIARALGGDFSDALGTTYKMFKQWCSASRVSCSQRRWTQTSLHMTGAVENYPWLKAKAFNARIILGWLAAHSPQSNNLSHDSIFIDVSFNICVYLILLNKTHTQWLAAFQG